MTDVVGDIIIIGCTHSYKQQDGERIILSEYSSLSPLNVLIGRLGFDSLLVGKLSTKSLLWALLAKLNLRKKTLTDQQLGREVHGHAFGDLLRLRLLRVG